MTIYSLDVLLSRFGTITTWHQSKVKSESVSYSVMSSSLFPHGLQPAKLTCPWNSPGKDTGVDNHFHLHRISPTQESNPISYIAGRFFNILATREACSSSKGCYWIHAQSLSHVWLFATHGLYPSRLLCPWKFPGKNGGVGCHFLPQRSSWPRHLTLISCVSCR